METPIFLFLAFVSFTFIFVVISLVRKLPVGLAMAGLFMLPFVVMTDDIRLGEPQYSSIPDSSTQFIITNTTNHMNQNTFVIESELFAGSTTFIGQRVDNDNSLLTMKRVNQVILFLDKDGVPSGDVFIGIWNRVNNPSATNYEFLLGQKPALEVSATGATYTFTRNDTKTYLLSPLDVIGIFFNGGSGGNSIGVRSNNTASSFDGANSYCSSFTSPTWTDTTTCDRTMKISLVETGLSINNDNEFTLIDDGLFKFTAFVKVIFALFATMLMLLGALMVYRND